jgi:hypothetical protein
MSITIAILHSCKPIKCLQVEWMSGWPSFPVVEPEKVWQYKESAKLLTLVAGIIYVCGISIVIDY